MTTVELKGSQNWIKDAGLTMKDYYVGYSKAVLKEHWRGSIVLSGILVLAEVLMFKGPDIKYEVDKKIRRLKSKKSRKSKEKVSYM